MELIISSNFDEIAHAFEELKVEVMQLSARRAINRTLPTLQKESIKLLKEKIKIKPSTLKQKHIALTKARGKVHLYGVISFNTHPIPMIEFVKGNKSVIQQKGIPVKRRRKLRIEITPGRKVELKKAFIQKVKTKQVFKRPQGGEGFKKQGIRSIGHLVFSRGIAEKLGALGQQRFALEFNRDLSARIKHKIGSIRPPA